MQWPSIHQVPSWVQSFFSAGIWHGPPHINGKPCVYLTFDDGPVYGPTEFVLNTLESYNAKATFFAVGDNVVKHPKLADRIVASGHTLANHTYNHLKGWSTSNEAYYYNIDQCAQQLQRFTQAKPKLFRPPYGQITPRQIQHLTNHGYSIIFWSVLTVDYDALLPAETCLRETYKRLKPGSIIVFHDSLKAEKNLKACLTALLEALLADGYQIVAL